MAEEKPKVLILGGVGFIGRNLVKYLLDNNLTSFIRCADKSPPGVAYLHPDHKACFAQKDKVHAKQADCSRPAMAAGLFADHEFDYVINLCGETRQALPEGDYKQKGLEAAQTMAAEAAKHNIKKWVEVSHGGIYYGDQKQSTEEGKIAPWTNQSNYRSQAETAVRATAGLPVVTLRPAIVYGPGDVNGLCPRIAAAATYKKTKESMKMLWGESLRLNTVHVNDVCSAIWLACTEFAAGAVYNLEDGNDLTQGKLNTVLAKIFQIKTSYYNSIMSNMAKQALDYTASQSNNKHMPVWRDILLEGKIMNTPVSPYLDAELLKDNHMSVNGTKIIKDTSFRYAHPALTEDLLRAQIQFQITQGLFPNVL